MYGLIEHTDEINRLLARYGVKFGIYKNNVFNERLFPFDTVPRILSADEFGFLSRGLRQRVTALNMFLNDIYTAKRIVKDRVIPEEFVYGGAGYMMECEGAVPPKGIFCHISGIDLVQGSDMRWYVLEDNLRIPSGASYPMIARELCRRASPDTFRANSVVDNRNYGELLKKVLDYSNCGGINVVLTPGRFNSAFFEHTYLAEKTGSVFAMPQDLFVEGNVLYYSEYSGRRQRVGAVYRRISDDFLDPMTFRADSLLGVPHIMDAYRAGNTAIVNAPGNSVADDKGIYYYVPAMIKYYLGEDAILSNAPTYLPFYESDRKYVLENISRLVIKDVAESGGYGVVFGSELSLEQIYELKKLISKQPRRFIAQEVISFNNLRVFENGVPGERKADLRAFVLMGEETVVWQSGLTRFAKDADSFIVNSSQGGGFKDTWVLSR